MGLEPTTTGITIRDSTFELRSPLLPRFWSALAAGHDGLDFVRRILLEAGSHLNSRGLLVCEVGDARRALGRAYPRIPFTWVETSESPSCVFALQREELPA